MAAPQARYLVFDIESVADGELVSNVRYPGEALSAEAAIDRYRKELLEKYDSDFIPYTFQIPVAVSVAKIDSQYRMFDLVSLDTPQFRPHVITEHFWRGWQQYQMPTLVSFNGRTFDLPLLELAAFRYGVSVPDWFNLRERSYDQKRNRYNLESHFDLHDILTNFGASRLTGGLNLIANILGKPGKMDVAGHMVQDLYNERQLERINGYCCCDVLDTYFVFLRTLVLTGRISLDQERELVQQTKSWLEDRRDKFGFLEGYMNGWGDWRNPWPESDV